jgi:glucosamine-6-phosphate deaminase
VKRSLEDEISPMTPASILRMHANTTLYLDRESAALLSPATRGALHDD